ncbi:TonB-dependent receptor [Rhodobacter sp. Har01]|uniref:TonB-dependent receptor plug domain-containing protein n=1 Tax=Rhodobacter sp. Har01 TaxID=2883999 RepID=UPI001D088B68|nr:TonB-dependent receptor [Rhodobacter sp. Har01]MCB6178820.1 TonB-dependent receptor [Rhodobacter sp. Har01]
MKRLAVSLIALLAATPAPAQDIELAEIVVSALRTAVERLRTGVSVDVVDAEDLRKSRDTTVAAALSRLPGVSLSQSGPFGSTAALRVRGADGRYLAVYVDGIRVSDPSGTNVSFDFGSLMTADVSRIEVLRGSQSALWGGSAVGGVIAITTLGATEEGLHQTATVEAGSFGTARLSYGLTQKTDRLDLAFAATRLRTDGYSAFDGGAEDDGAEATRLSFSARYQASDVLTLGGAVFAQDTTQDYDGYTPAFVLGDLIGYSQTRRETGARVFAEWATGNTDHVFDLALYDTDRSYDQAGDIATYGGRRVTFSWQGTTQVSPALSFVYGADWSEETAEYSNLPGGSASTDIAGVFAQAIWAPSETLDIAATLRSDHNSGFGDFATGRLALAWRPADGTTLRAAYATGFRAPSIDERFGDYPGFFPFVGNPDLQPEESESIEVGIEQQVGAATLSATLFRLDVDNLITYQFGAPSTLVNLPGVSTRQGVELAAAVPVSDAVTLGLAYTYTDGRRPDGSRLIQVPYHDLALSVDAQMSDRLSGGLTLTHVAGRIDNDANTFLAVAMPDYTVLNGQVSYDLTDTTQAYLRVENLLDADYQMVNGYAASGRAVYLGVEAKF